MVQTEDYYPFGGEFNSYQRENSLPNRYKFNGESELVNDLDLQIYLTDYRVYDPWGRLGWWQIDPKTEAQESFSPYHFSYDNPIRYNDPKGDCPPGVNCDSFAKGAWNAVKSAGQFIADTYNTRGQNIVNAAKNIDALATVASASPGLAAGIVISNVEQTVQNKVIETGSPNAAASEIMGEVAGGVLLGAATDKGISKLGTVIKGVDHLQDVAKVSNKLDGSAVEVAEGGIPRIQNAANKIDKPITLVGSRASGTANSASDFDYVIKGLTNADWKKIKNSLPGSANTAENLPRRIDIFKGSVNTNKPHITVKPNHN